MSLIIKILESLADVITDKIIYWQGGEARYNRNLKFRQKEALDKLYDSYCKEASYFAGREITEEEYRQKAKEYHEYCKRQQNALLCSGTGTPVDTGNRHALVVLDDSGSRCNVVRRK